MFAARSSRGFALILVGASKFRNTLVSVSHYSFENTCAACFLISIKENQAKKSIFLLEVRIKRVPLIKMTT